MLFHDVFEYWARARPESCFAAQDGEILSYAEADERANRIANAFLSAGLRAGDRVAFLSKNTLNMLLLYQAASKAGVVPVSLNYRLAPPEWAYILRDSGAKMILAQADFRAGIDNIRNACPELQSFILLGDSPKAPWREFADWYTGQSPAKPARDSDDGCPLYQMYTSGTIGHPKGVIITHRAFYTNLTQFVAMMLERPRVGDRGLVVTPLYHAAAVYISSLLIYFGMTVILHADFKPEKVVADLEAERITFTFLVPAMIQECLTAVPDIESRDWRHLKAIMYGASPIAISVLREAIRVFRCGFYQAYGMTETSAILTILDPEDHVRALAGEEGLLLSAGRAMPGTRLRIVDEADNPRPNGIVGEVVASGEQMMTEYWRLPEETAKTLRSGWLHTGDAANMDDEGYIYIQDRIKDMIVSGGENIYPREIENVLFDHPSIIDAAVVGVPDEKYGEALMAFLVLESGPGLSPDDVIAFCRERLGGYKVPRRIQFVDDLPRNASGKVLKKELRAPYWRSAARQVG